ncbi:MAG TPA: LLM class flavin-dependent oxidoreductase [Pseudonocardia sp.]|nr:LLM class flavin-dependent oxidoreductase [Pseudonocardia sp.]
MSDNGNAAGWPLEFGVFMPPISTPVHHNTHLQLNDCVDLITHLDRLGFHEAWVGEHHSGGAELICSPEVFLAHTASRTRNIRLGTGVVSLPYHHPFTVAGRIALLDHLTAGRVIFGAGPGLLATDAYMLGIEPEQQRRMMGESLEVILELFAGKRVTRETDWFRMNEAALQVRPYQFPHPELALAATFSPSGPTIAAKYGAGLLSLAAATPAGFEVLAEHWGILESESGRYGRVPDRRSWRHVVAMHIATTEAQAVKEVEWGLRATNEYLSGVLPGVTADPSWSHSTLVEKSREGGFLIGTPEMAIDLIERLKEKSGGFGKFLIMNLDLADREARFRSFELFAREVMPRFTHASAGAIDSYDWSRAAGDRWLNRTVGAIKAAGGMRDTSALRT